MITPRLVYEETEVGTEIPAVVIDGVTRSDFVRYAGASGDFMPIHYDQTFAEAAGVPTVFAQGMLTAGLLSRALTDYVGVGCVCNFNVRFSTRVWPGDRLTCGGRVTNKLEATGRRYIEGTLVVTNQKGETAVKGTFRALAR